MSDQCKNCVVRGDVEKCMLTICNQHESWVATVRMKRIEELENIQRIAQKDYDRLVFCIEDLLEIIKAHNEGEECDHSAGVCYCGEYVSCANADSLIKEFKT